MKTKDYIARIALVLVGILVVFSAVTGPYLFAQVRQESTQNTYTAQRVDRVQCGLYHDLATVQPSVKPPSSKLGIQIITDSRNAYTGLGCKPDLPAPSALLVKDAAKFGIPVKH